MAKFKFTQEQLKAIYDGDMDARNAFFFDNLDIIKRMAYFAIYRERYHTVTVDDLVNGVYVDMDYFCSGINTPVRDYGSLIAFLHWSFHLAPYGGLAYCRVNNTKITTNYKNNYSSVYTGNNYFLSLDATIGDSKNARTFGERIGDPSAEQAFEGVRDNTDEYAKVFGEFLTPKLRDVFVLMLDGYDLTHIADKLGVTLGAAIVRKMRIRQAFEKHSAEVFARLAEYGIDGASVAEQEPKRNYKTSAKERERCRAYYLRKKSRKLAESGVNVVS